MTRLFVTVIISALGLLSILLMEISVCKLTYNENLEESKEILKVAYDIVNSPENEESSLLNEEDIIGVLKINKLNVEAPIKEGTSQQIMKTSIGHFSESDYWNGNVSFASHNSGTSAHYFEKINTLNSNDEIEYITKFGTKKYKVESIKKIDSTDWSMVEKSDDKSKNTVTLITCINGQPDYRLCVRGVEI